MKIRLAVENIKLYIKCQMLYTQNLNLVIEKYVNFIIVGMLRNYANFTQGAYDHFKNTLKHSKTITEMLLLGIYSIFYIYKATGSNQEYAKMKILWV